jgi:hypothetical protein
VPFVVGCSPTGQWSGYGCAHNSPELPRLRRDSSHIGHIILKKRLLGQGPLRLRRGFSSVRRREST